MGLTALLSLTIVFCFCIFILTFDLFSLSPPPLCLLQWPAGWFCCFQAWLMLSMALAAPPLNSREKKTPDLTIFPSKHVLINTLFCCCCCCCRFFSIFLMTYFSNLRSLLCSEKEKNATAVKGNANRT